MADPGIPINCPRCGTPLTYERTDEHGTHFYRCPGDGMILLTPDGKVKEQPH